MLPSVFTSPLSRLLPIPLSGKRPLWQTVQKLFNTVITRGESVHWFKQVRRIKPTMFLCIEIIPTYYQISLKLHTVGC